MSVHGGAWGGDSVDVTLASRGENGCVCRGYLGASKGTCGNPDPRLPEVSYALAANILLRDWNNVHIQLNIS